jgi:PIN domain nuclease of toxin-antitoxin system
MDGVHPETRTTSHSPRRIRTHPCNTARPSNAIRVEPFDQRMWPHFEVVSLELSDPFDSAVVATARALAVPLVTSDAAIAKSGLVEIVW